MNDHLKDAPFLYFTSNDDGIINEVNELFCRKSGYTPEELVGGKIDKILTVPTRIFFQTHLVPLVKMQGYAEEIFITLLSKDDSELPLLFNCQRKITDGGAITLFAGILVQNRKKFEDELVAAKRTAEKALHENIELLKAKQELQEHAEKLDEQMFLVKKQNEEWLQFNRVVTHDLQEPLRKLHVFTNLFSNEEGHTGSQALEKIQNVAQQMRSTVSGLQQYVWLTEAEVNAHDIDIEELLSEVLARLHAEHPGVDIELKTEGHFLVKADREQITFLLYQLLSNSVQFRKQGQPVKLHLLGTTLFRNKFKALNEKYKYVEQLKLQVRDNGIGFDAMYSQHVFLLFKTLHKQSGRGVGLALCRKIVENHNGSILIDSKENEGTTVTIFLPLYPVGQLMEKEEQNIKSNQIL